MSTDGPNWWSQPRRLAVVVDNPSWILPYAEQLVEKLLADGDEAILCRDYESIPEGDIAFFLGCIRLTPVGILKRNRRNLVVHESAVPQGRGFSPLTWQILEGCNRIPLALMDMAEDADAGPVVLSGEMLFEGHELIEEMRVVQGQASVELCRRFLAQPSPLPGVAQAGEPSYYPRRRPKDSVLDPNRSIAEQFELLRVVDNQRYPAFFDFRGHRYKLIIEKLPSEDGSL